MQWGDTRRRQIVHRRERQYCSYEALYPTHVALLIGCGERYCMAIYAHPSGASNAMDVIFRASWKVVIHNEFDTFHVYPARSDVGCNEDAIFSVLKSFEGFFPLTKRSI